MDVKKVKVKEGFRIRNPATGRILTLTDIVHCEHGDPLWNSYWRRRIAEGSCELFTESVVKSEPEKPKVSKRQSKKKEEPELEQE